MKRSENRRHMAFEALTLLVIMAVLLYITRLWPILIPVLVAIFITVMELIYLSNQDMDLVEPESEQPNSTSALSESHLSAYEAIQAQITQRLQKDYPNARWVWENPRVREDIIVGNPVFILLNKAGGYRRGQVVFQGVSVEDVLFTRTSVKPATPVTLSEQASDPGPKEAVTEDFGLIAFQWVDAHIMEISTRMNEAIAFHLPEILVRADELPVRESWEEICLEFSRNDLPDTVCCNDGILIKIKQ